MALHSGPVPAVTTWTPQLRIGGSTTGITYSRQEGRVAKAGQLVFATCDFILTSKGGLTGSVAIIGLPFAALTTSPTCKTFAGVLQGYTNCASMAALFCTVSPNTTVVALNLVGATGQVALDAANLTDTSTLSFAFTYLSN